MQEKLCNRCKQKLDLSLFWKDKHQPNGYRTYCKKCDSSRTREWQKRNQEKINSWHDAGQFKRVEAGQCRHCLKKSLKDRNLCERHYITNMASNAIGKADKITVDKLTVMFYERPYCPYTGEVLIMGVNAHIDHIKSRKNHPELRGDLENVEWISETANLCKSCLNKDDFILFCQKVVSRFS